MDENAWKGKSIATVIDGQQKVDGLVEDVDEDSDVELEKDETSKFMQEGKHSAWASTPGISKLND